MAETCRKHSCASCPMRQTTEWAGLTSEQLELLDKYKVERQYKPGDSLYHQGDDSAAVYCVHSGLIGLRRLDADGNSVLIRMANPGETIGYRSFLKRETHNLTAEALAPSNVCTIESWVARKLLEDNPDLGLRFLQHSMDELDEIEERFVQTRTWPAKARLLHTLLIFNERHGTQTETGAYRLELPITRRELASVVGTTPEAMSRLVREVHAEGLVQIDGRTVTINDLDQILDTLPSMD